MEKIRVGIIGQGRSGRDIHRHLFETQAPLRDRYEVVAIADYIGERCVALPGVAPSPELKIYTDYKELLKNRDIDLIINATCSKDHVALSIEALEAGFNVICEKPVARRVADFDRLVSVAERTGKFFLVFQQSRFRHLFRKSLEVMHSGVLGRIIEVKISYNSFGRRWDWQTLQSMDGGELLNTGPHPLDQALQFYGDADPERVICLMDRVNSFGDAEDHVKLLLSGNGHPSVDLEISRCCMFPGSTYEIYGSCGGLRASGDTVEWRYFKPSEAPEQKLISVPLEGAGRLPKYCGEELYFYNEKWVAPAFAQSFDAWGIEYYKQIYEALRNGVMPEVNLAQIRRQVKVIEECHRQNPLPRMDRQA